MPEQQYFDEAQVIAWFSCGITSAVASKLAVAEFPQARVVYCNLSKAEHPDNKRFMAQVSAWIGRPIETIQSKRYETPDQVFEKERFMSGPYGAKCTTELKKMPRLAFARPDDVHIFGFSANEKKRIAEFEQRNPDLRLDWILARHRITKSDCFAMVKAAGIAEPAMYGLGFKNNNCLGCVKARGVAYWLLTRQKFPEVFARRVVQSRALNVRLLKVKDVLYFLDEIDALAKDPLEPQEQLTCGPECAST